MPVSLITFYTPQFRYSKNRLVRSACDFGIEDIHVYDQELFKATGFYREHYEITSQPRGAGYWLWKPYYVLQHLKELGSHDVLIYCDAGLEISNDISPLVERCLKDDKGLILFYNYQGAAYTGPGFEKTDDVLYNECRKNRYWGKRDAFVLMNCDNSSYWDSPQLEGCLLVIRKTTFAMAFVEEWLHYCSIKAIITDSPNTQGLPNHNNFIMHTHDQLILSLLAFKHRINLYRCPSQFGNHKKEPAYRKKGEFILLPYSTPEPNSEYDTLFLHHRTKKMPLIKQTIFDVKVFFKKWFVKIGLFKHE